MTKRKIDELILYKEHINTINELNNSSSELIGLLKDENNIQKKYIISSKNVIEVQNDLINTMDELNNSSGELICLLKDEINIYSKQIDKTIHINNLQKKYIISNKNIIEVQNDLIKTSEEYQSTLENIIKCGSYK
jgi:hypothetical protein